MPMRQPSAVLEPRSPDVVARESADAAVPFSSVCDILERASAAWPDHVALQIGTEPETYTFRQTFQLARNLSRSLRERGIEPGDRIAIWSPAGPRWAIAYLAVLYSGAVVVPLDFDGAESQTHAVLLETGCRLVFTVADRLAAVRRLRAAVPSLSSVITLDSAPGSDDAVPVEILWHERDGVPSRVPIRPEDVATIIYTSGTTGVPKGAVISHASVATVIAGVLEYLEVGPGDNVLAVLPSHHVFAPIGSLFVPLAAGATITYMHGVGSPELVKTLQTAGITAFPCVPDVFYLVHKRIFEAVRQRRLAVRLLFRSLLAFSRWMRERLGITVGRRLFPDIHRKLGGRLRLLISGGAYFDPQVIRDFHALGFTVQQGYGLTETFGGGTLTPVRRNASGSVGASLPHVAIRIVNPDDTGVGEVAISGPTVMQGYLNDPELTSQVLRDGWLYTGDLGHQDAAGNLYITGRRKEMIVLSSGKKVAPEELEKHYLQSPCIKEVCVLGVSPDSDYAGTTALHAIVVPDFEYVRTHKLASMGEAIRDDIEDLSARLPPYKRILTYSLRADPLPRTATRKVMRWILQDELDVHPPNARAWRGRDYRYFEGDDRLLASETSKKVLELLTGKAALASPLHLDMNLELDLGFDSIERVELVANLEQLVGHDFDDAIDQCLTVRDLLKEIERTVDESRTRLAGASPKSVTWQGILESARRDEISKDYILERRPLSTLFNFVALRIIFGLAKVLFRLEVRGLDNLPARGPYLICPNHQSYLDGILVCAVLPYRVFSDLFSLGWAPFFTGGLKGVLARLINTIPISANSNVLDAMKISAVGLSENKILLIFPEGGVSLDGKPQPFKPGAAILARRLRVPVVPVAIKGSYGIWAKGGDKVRLAPVKIAIGRAVTIALPGQEPQDAGEQYADDVRRIEREVNDLLATLYESPAS